MCPSSQAGNCKKGAPAEALYRLPHLALLHSSKSLLWPRAAAATDLSMASYGLAEVLHPYLQRQERNPLRPLQIHIRQWVTTVSPAPFPHI